MKLYYKQGACSLAPHIIAKEIGVDLELIAVDLQTNTLKEGTSFSVINPKGYVPALQLDKGTILTEGIAIDLYLASLKPESTIAPKLGSVEYFEMISWLTFIATEVHKSFGPLFMKLKGMKIDEALVVSTENQLKSRFQLIDDQLAATPYLMGRELTCADIYLFVTLNWTFMLGLSLESYPHIQKFHQMLNERASVKAAMAAEA